MLNDKLKKLAVQKARLEKLEQALLAETQRELAGLPAEYGFANVKDFIKAVKKAAAGGRRGPAKAQTGKKRRARAVITDATRARVKSMVDAGKTGGEIASAVGISLPSVHNIKKSLGLVKARR
ncbi:MAG: hypothetical protein RL324_547 [Verrucomicrobiota bacterium]|jgi:hypothetical protein